MKKLLFITMSLLISVTLLSTASAQQRDSRNSARSSQTQVKDSRTSSSSHASSSNRSSSSRTENKSTRVEPTRSTARPTTSHAQPSRDDRHDNRKPQVTTSRPSTSRPSTSRPSATRPSTSRPSKPTVTPSHPHRPSRPSVKPSRPQYSRPHYSRPSYHRPPVVNTLPVGHRVKRYKGNYYYMHNGRYYAKHNSSFSWVIPPFGFRVTTIPSARLSFWFNNRVYYSYAGILYRHVRSDIYEVIRPQRGMIIPELPEYNVREVIIDGMIYFEFENILYKQIPTRYGVQYEVLGEFNY